MKFALLASVVVSVACIQAGFAEDTAATRSIRMPLVRETTAVAAPATATIPMWTGTAGTYSYTMAGQSPAKALTSPTTTISVQILPVALVFGDGTKLDPTASDKACSPAGSALSLLEQSPLFNNFAYSAGSTIVGTTQYLDFFQRANFWQYAGPGGVNPNYHILLNAAPHALTTINVPASEGQTSTAACGRLGKVSLPWLDSYLQNTVFPTAGILPTQLALVLLYNAATYEPSLPGSLILGYHSAFSNGTTGNAIQTYAVGDFDTTGNFGSTRDVADLSHEIGEWLDDPLGTSPTPSWGNIGQVAGCQTNLEAGDPLSGTNVTVTMTNAYVYHLQEFAFASWFYHDSPSKGVNGWYSSNGTLKTSAAACSAAATATTTTLALGATSLSAGSPVTAAIAVHAASGTAPPTGSVTLVTSTGTLLKTFTLANGAATGSVTLPAGSYSVTAQYAGSSLFTASNSAPVPVVVTAAVATTTTLALSATKVSPSAPVTVSIAVKAASGATPAGNVTLVTSAGATLATFPLANGSVSGSVSFPTGSYTVTAKYAGSAGLAASNSSPVSVVSTLVTNVSAATTTSLTLSATTVAAGTAVTAIIAVRPASGTSTPTGNVTLITSTGMTLGTFTLTGGAASGSVVLSAGTYTVTAKYGGSAAFTTSTSPAVSVVSTLRPTTTTLSFSSTVLSAAGSVTATIVVKPSSGTGTPTGTVALVSNTGTRIATVSLASGAFSGKVTLPAGSYTVTAQYSGSSAFAASNSAAVTINPAPVLTLNPTSLNFGSITVGTKAAARTVTVKNTGGAAAKSLPISASGMDAADFTWTTTCGAVLAVNASCSVQVSFKPSAKGARTAKLSIGGPTVALQGSGK